jgi:hypothetical protein
MHYPLHYPLSLTLTQVDEVQHAQQHLGSLIRTHCITFRSVCGVGLNRQNARAGAYLDALLRAAAAEAVVVAELQHGLLLGRFASSPATVGHVKRV